LNSAELDSIVDNEITPRVLAEWKVDPESVGFQCEDDGQGRSVADRFGVFTHS
jgi:hypothetical protein